MRRIIVDVACIISLVFFDHLVRLLFGWSVFSLFPNFDKVFHFATGILLADIYFCLPFKKNTFYIVIFVLVVSVIWECVEPFLGFIGIGEMSSLFTPSWIIDTLGDIGSAMVGAMIYSFLQGPYDEVVPAQ